MKRTVEQWAGCKPRKMAAECSKAAIAFALEDARADIIELHALAERVAKLEPATREHNPGIGAGTLNQLIEQAKQAIKLKP